MTVGIENIEYYLPKKVISSRDLADKFGFSLSFIEEKIGVRRLYVADADEWTSDLAIGAISKIFNKRPEIRDRIGIIAICTQTPDYQLPHTSAIVHGKLGLRKDVACFDLGLGCSGFVYGMSVLKSFMEENDMEYGLLVTAETYSKIIDVNDKNTKSLFSDAAAATLLGRNPCLVPGRFTFCTDGTKYQSLILKLRCGAISSSKEYLSMDGRGIFELVVAEVPKDIHNCLRINGISLEEIDYFVFHQASMFLMTALTKALRIEDRDRVVKYIDRFGNTVSSTIPICLRNMFDVVKDKNLKIMLSGFGVGLSWSSTVLNSKGGKVNVG